MPARNWVTVAMLIASVVMVGRRMLMSKYFAETLGAGCAATNAVAAPPLQPASVLLPVRVKLCAPTGGSVKGITTLEQVVRETSA